MNVRNSQIMVIKGEFCVFFSGNYIGKGATQKGCTIFYDFIAFLSPERALNNSPGQRPG